MSVYGHSVVSMVWLVILFLVIVQLTVSAIYKERLLTYCFSHTVTACIEATIIYNLYQVQFKKEGTAPRLLV